MRLRKIKFRRHIPAFYAKIVVDFHREYNGNQGFIGCGWENEPRKKVEPVKEKPTSLLYRLLRML